MEETKVEKTIYVDGIKFTLSKKGYYDGYHKRKRLRLHRYIWEKHNGPIPEGYDVHHIDGNKLNNDISNLIMLTPSEHHKIHANALTEEQKARRDELFANLVRAKACEWHGSDAGIEWHKKHGKEVSEHLHDVKIKKVCKCCGKEFYDNGFNKGLFCSNNCKSKWRREAGLDNEKRTCIICGKEFITNKYSKAKTCSESCSSTYAYSRRKGRVNYEAGRESNSVQHDSGQESQLFSW